MRIIKENIEFKSTDLWVMWCLYFNSMFWNARNIESEGMSPRQTLVFGNLNFKITKNINKIRKYHINFKNLINMIRGNLFTSILFQVRECLN
jgi:hypothetical protein